MNKLSFFIFLLPFSAGAQIHAAKIFSDHMVLQRDQPVHIWGKASPGKTIVVSFSGVSKSIAVKPDSTWSVYFKKQKANTQPQAIRIEDGKETLVFNDILIGDIWLCSGQSNMEWRMEKEMHWDKEKFDANQPLIRFTNPPPAGRYVYGVPYTDTLNQRLTSDRFYLWDGWKKCDSQTIKSMSAVAYYFAKQIVSSKNIPIGLINLSIGGAPIETFISREALESSKQFSAKIKGNWLENDNLPEWVRERGKQNVGKNVSGNGDESGLNHAYKPGFAYSGGIAPILPMPIKGVLWYQGESNALEMPRVEEYKDLLHLLIEDYRNRWNQPTMPFLWVQLSSIDTLKYHSQYWPQFRNEQRKLLNEVKHGGMAVTSDIGFRDDVHPTDKKSVGERLARWALHFTYKKNIVPSGPLPLKAKYINGNIVIRFRYAEKGLRTANGKSVTGFSTNGKTETEAIIQTKKIIIAVKEKPSFIYYGWQPFSTGNLVNAEGLPASTFKLKVL
ncbi:MAG: hypothetical protein IT250_03535 [Chitinophagaceae bacterium]|nr:hypothetical protein [Chitinophagaceae bacterium]